MSEVEERISGGDCRNSYMHKQDCENEGAFCKELSILCIEDRVVVNRAIQL